MRKIDLNNFQVATSETARDVNSRIMLNLVRKHQPVSRADLMRFSGLQRSTVSVIADQLISERWLREGALGQALRGRKPTYLHLNEERAGIFGINLQPGNTDLALANLGGKILYQESLRTPASTEIFVETVAGKVREWMKKHPEMTYDSIGVSLPGRVDLQSQQFVFAPNLGWKSTDLKAQLEKATGLEVEMENAANACALSEFWFGQHHDGVRNLVVVTVSEGIGVGMILNGQIVRGSSGLAGEFGHVPLNESGPTCRCGNRGCWEQYASDAALVRAWQEAGGVNKGPGGILEDSLAIVRLARDGDVPSLRALRATARQLALGFVNLIAALNPQAIIMGEPFASAWDLVEDVVRAELWSRLPPYSLQGFRLLPSRIGADSALRGAAALVLAHFLTRFDHTKDHSLPNGVSIQAHT